MEWSKTGNAALAGEGVYRVIRWCLRHWFLLSLAVVVTLGFVGGEPLQEVAAWDWLRNSIVALVMFLMALPIEAREFAKTLRHPLAPLLAIGLSYGFQPLVTWPIAQLFSPELAGGLIVASIVPCTLASAAVWTRRAAGNDAIALTVTVVTNAICFLVAPVWLWLLLGQDSDSGRWLAQIPKLALLVVAPMIVAQILRRSDRIAQGSKKHKISLGVVAQIGILAMVLLGTAQIPAKLESVPVLDSVSGIVVMSLVVVGIHVTSLMAGWYLARGLKLSPADAAAVAISGSQKTLMVGLSLALDLGASVLPLITYHVTQLFVDTWIAERFLKPRVISVSTSEVGTSKSTET